MGEGDPLSWAPASRKSPSAQEEAYQALTGTT